MNDDTDIKEQEAGKEQPETVTDECTDKLVIAEQKRDEAEANFKRALADYQNLEKRVREERVQWIKAANKDLLLRVLSVLDTLLLAKKHSDEKTLHIVTQQFLDVLKAEGVIRIETVGKKFDPKLMECITVEEGKEGEVLEELRPGFLLHDIVLRPAHVKVGKKKE